MAELSRELAEQLSAVVVKTIAVPLRNEIKALRAELDALHAEIAPLRKRVKSLELDGAQSYVSGREYQPGDRIEFAGIAWRCMAPTTAEPGRSDRWQQLTP